MVILVSGVLFFLKQKYWYEHGYGMIMLYNFTICKPWVDNFNTSVWQWEGFGFEIFCEMFIPWYLMVGEGWKKTALHLARRSARLEITFWSFSFSPVQLAWQTMVSLRNILVLHTLASTLISSRYLMLIVMLAFSGRFSWIRLSLFSGNVYIGSTLNPVH